MTKWHTHTLLTVMVEGILKVVIYSNNVELALVDQIQYKPNPKLAKVGVLKSTATNIDKTISRLSWYPSPLSGPGPTVVYGPDPDLSATTKPRPEDTTSSGDPPHHIKNKHQGWLLLPTT